jgi:RimJ/RimL family protein N-acetyltransferase
MIVTERLELRVPDPAEVQAIMDGDRSGRRWHEEFPRQDDRDGLSVSLLYPHDVFGCFVIAEKSTGLAVGTIGFFGPPDETGQVMVGYGLVPSARGRGYATEALKSLVDYAFAEPSVHRIVADPLRDNRASHNVLEKAGFVHTHSTDEARWYAICRVSS